MRCIMKKLTILLLMFASLFILSSCKKEEVEPPFEHNVPKETYVNLQELPYASYISLNNPVVTITVKDIGEMKVQLFPEVAPNTVNNFIQYIQDGAYDNNTFHRVVENFVIQGGQLETPACTIAGEMSSNDFENDLDHWRGVVSMARYGDDKNSASSQFFIVQTSSGHLDGFYAPFGGVVSGFNVLDYINSLQQEGVEIPITTITITSITIDIKTYVPVDRVCYVEPETD